MRYILQFLCFLVFVSCAVTSRPSTMVTKGKPVSVNNFVPTPKGPIVFQKITAADWVVDRGGLINLKDPKAKAAGLKSEEEPIQIYFYVIDHPKFGRYVIDTGLSQVFRKDPKEWPVSWIVASVMNTSALKVKLTVDEWLKKEPKKVEGIFLTHLHLDHIMGTSDFSSDVPIYVGPKEATAKKFINSLVQGSTDGLLGEKVSFSELDFAEAAKNSSYPAIDFFGDQSLIIIHVEGHTKGSLAFLVQSSSGSHLILGDSCHTSWGWENGVSPGDFTEDQEKNQSSLNFLKEFASKISGIRVHPGHQSLPEK
ncbi:MBL fold metallo-hydrolase [Leptospira sanjuanensis]|uniref:MBL fold metallo-hydrolase n=1 Tax=Leptospira sanjuanensis TaxID=2879643 RepID=UPI001EE828C8|nr:MBL fold metallo-hydrolase [Leptospira sanjuanensis]MCG6166713.1 MBL fold metallo-hydrolase [Leptospira sanjuanensis]